MNEHKDRYISYLGLLIKDLQSIKTILKKIRKDGITSDAEKLLLVYDNLFKGTDLSKHIEYDVTLVSKSTNALFAPIKLTNETANRHIKLNLKSKDVIWIDELYDNQISDLLKFYVHVFSTIENYSIHQNERKVKKFEALIDEIKVDISDFISISEEADKMLPSILRELKSKEFVEEQLRKDGIKFKSNWKLFVNLIQEKGIKKLYHFTDKSNLLSILNMKSLFSWKYCVEKGITIPKPGGTQQSRDFDVLKGAENYVRLSFCENLPMKDSVVKHNHIQNPILLHFDPEVMFLTGTKYSEVNAIRAEAKISDELEYLKGFRFDLFSKEYRKIKRKLQKYFMAEVLVYEQIPLKYILNIKEYMPS